MTAARDVLVTGCSSGLGRATALFLRERGWRVHATARADDDLAELTRLGLEPVKLDLCSSASIAEAVDTVLQRTKGKLDAAVNNAGYSQLGAVEDLTRDELRAQFETNVFGTIELTGRVLPVFRAQRAGTVVFISSVCARVSVPYLGCYSASKAALEALVDALRLETRGSGIRVHVVEPGIFNTGCYAATSKHFNETSRSRHSLHAERCTRVLRQFADELATLPEERNVFVARAVGEFLDGKRQAARRIVPRPAQVYEVARRFLPDRVLDALLVTRRGGD
jgi:NAD(P)-dependent dehydrogenase (short-subunit alcohol dehydrogenase family)